ncbi:hypothetical protein L7F22_057111 [Adiantum nelumboides]|nr:hypothetical protein [Adiantum nelumboides]
MVAQPQVLQRSVSPQPVAEIPPLPNNNGERAVNVISIEGKGKAKMIEPCVMPIKKARMSEEANLRRDTMETEDEAGISRKEKKRKKSETSRRRIGIKDFPLGAATEAYDLLEDVSSQGPKLSWPQLLHLSPKMRRQWSRLVSTRKPRLVGAITAQPKDILPIVKAQIKGKSVSNVYVDGGAQVCVMSEKMMHTLGLEVNNLEKLKAKMANNRKAKFLGIAEGVKVTVFGTQVSIDMYVLPTKGEGYPIILGRPWLMAMRAYQDWDKGTLVLKPQGKGGKSRSPIIYSMKEGKLRDEEVETSEDEWSSESSSSTSEATSSDISTESENNEAPWCPKENATPKERKALKDWKQGKSKVMYWLSMSVSNSMMGYLESAASLAIAWKSLKKLNEDHTRVKKLQLKTELNTVKQGSMSINDYVSKIKTITNSLGSIGVTIDDNDVVAATLEGLGKKKKTSNPL